MAGSQSQTCRIAILRKGKGTTMHCDSSGIKLRLTYAKSTQCCAMSSILSAKSHDIRAHIP